MQLEQQRDEEIEMVIAKLEEESTKIQKEMEEKYHEKLKQAKQINKTLESKCQQATATQSKLEEQLNALERELQHKVT